MRIKSYACLLKLINSFIYPSLKSLLSKIEFIVYFSNIDVGVDHNFLLKGVESDLKGPIATP